MLFYIFTSAVVELRFTDPIEELVSEVYAVLNWEMSLYIICIVLSNVFLKINGNVSNSQCTPAVYAYDGSIDFTKTLYNCSKQMTDPEIIYSYKEGTGPITVYTQIGVNNLITIAELDSTMIVDIFFVLSWIDPRYFYHIIIFKNM